MKVLKEHGYEVKATDIADRGCPEYEYLDFLKNEEKFDGDIVTNPPYRFTTDFILKSLEAIPEGHKVAMLLRIQTLEGKDHYERVYKETPHAMCMCSFQDIYAHRTGSLRKSQEVRLHTAGLFGLRATEANLASGGYRQRRSRSKENR